MNITKTLSVLVLSVATLTACGGGDTQASPAATGKTNPICQGFDQGLSAAAVIHVGLGQGLTPEQVGTVLGESLRDCPEHVSKVEAFLVTGH